MKKIGFSPEVVQESDVASQMLDLENELARAKLFLSNHIKFLRRLFEALSYDDVAMGLSEAQVIERESVKLVNWHRLILNLQNQLLLLRSRPLSDSSAAFGQATVLHSDDSDDEVVLM